MQPILFLGNVQNAKSSLFEMISYNAVLFKKGLLPHRIISTIYIEYNERS